jgi:hypothetical protein
VVTEPRRGEVWWGEIEGVGRRRQLELIARTCGDWSPAQLLDLAAEGQEKHRRLFEDRQAAGDPRILHLIELGALDYIDNARRWLDAHAAELR